MPATCEQGQGSRGECLPVVLTPVLAPVAICDRPRMLFKDGHGVGPHVTGTPPREKVGQDHDDTGHTGATERGALEDGVSTAPPVDPAADADRRRRRTRRLAQDQARLLAENALLRQQLIVLRRQVQRPALTPHDRLQLVLLARLTYTWESALLIVQPQTLLHWHQQGYRLVWRARSAAARKRPQIAPETVALIQQMTRENRLWGAERIRGELLKLGLRVSKRTVQRHIGGVRPPLRSDVGYHPVHARA